MNKFYFITFAVLALWTGQSKAQTQVDSMSFHKDYFPGQNDINGRYLGSTETMAIVQHKGKLFAGMGNWMDYPITLQSEGTQVLKKDSYNSPWVVDTTVGYSSLRSQALISATFEKDYLGNTLTTPVNLLVGGFGDILPPRWVSTWVRNDTTGIWHSTDILQVSSEAGIRSFCMHTDQVTQKQWLFCGVTAGSIVKVGYDPTAPGMVYPDATQELSGQGRVMAMAECNGNLYAAAVVEIVGTDTIGGLYKRIDGLNPSWQLVYRWPFEQGTNEKNTFRGLTCIPNPQNPNENVLIGTRYGQVEIINPNLNHQVTTEFNFRNYFGNLWYGGTYQPSVSIAAYNQFYPDTLNGSPIWWFGLWVVHPNGMNHPHNGSYFMQRNLSGQYKLGHIYDNAHPVPSGEALRGTRTIVKSPFPEDSSLVYYFGGYDCAGDTSNNTAWIYKGVLANLTTGINENYLLSDISIYPNPVSDFITIDSEAHLSRYKIFDAQGRIIQTGEITGGDKIYLSHLRQGIFFLQLQGGTGSFKTFKLIKQ